VKSFDSTEAFSRTLGWVNRQEQAQLQQKRVAIAGLGGVGGAHLLTLTRLGVGRFTISDFDSFEIANFNRQAGAFVSTLGEPKAQVLARMALDINPELDIRVLEQGINSQNMAEFLKDADVYVDGLDYFVIETRRAVFSSCAELGIPAVTAAPLGMSSALLTFTPDSMKFEDYFLLEGFSEFDQLIRFLVGLAPSMLQGRYLVDPKAIDFVGHRGPSTPMACDLCAGMVASEVLKILLNRGSVLSAPWSQQFDAYLNRFAKRWRPGGNRHPLQRLAIRALTRRLESR
jgi:molybdopterin/thiamine biosynthesis adenylyltransferase